MNTKWRVGLLPLLLLAGHAIAGQTVQDYYVDNRWDGGNEASLPHLRSASEGCISVLRNDMRVQQKNHPNNQWRYRLLNVGTDDGFSEFGCGGSVDELVTGIWSPIDTFSVSNNYVYQFFGSAGCASSDYMDPETGQCGPPKQPCCEAQAGDRIDAASGNKHQVETDYVGGGAFPLRFERSYDSSRTWRNDPVPIGMAWTHSYLASIYFMPDQGSGTITQAVAYRPDGTILRFSLNGSVWTADNDVALRLSATIDGNNIATATITTTDDTVEQYDGIGRLASITNRDGLTQTLSYVDGSGHFANDVQKVTDPQGHTLSFGYNASGQLASVTDGNGAVIQYGYDGNGNLASAVYPDAGGGTKTRSYTYNEAGQVAASWPHALTGISDETSTPGAFQRYASWNYDSEGRAVLSVHGPYDTGTIDRTALTFNPDGSTGFTDALGQQRTYGFAVAYAAAHPASLDVACDGCAARDKTRGYDGNGYPNASSDFDDNRATYAYAATDADSHPRGLQTQRVEGLPPAGDPTPDTSAERTVNTQWHASFRVPVQEDVLDPSDTTVQTTRWSYNGRGQPLFRCLVDPAVAGASSYTCGSQTNAPAGVRQWAWTWCESGGGCPLVGLPLTAKGPRTDVNDTTTYAWYANTDLSGCATGGACHYLGDLQAVTDALGHVTTWASYDNDGRPTRIVDGNGVPTDLAWHPRGWLSQRAVRNASTGTSGSDRITTWTWDIVGNPLRVTQPAGDYEMFAYDNAHRLTDVINKANERLHYALDDAGNRLEEDSYSASGSLKHQVLHDYDALGRLHHVNNAYTTPITAAMTYAYDGNGNVQTATDGRGHATIDTYDPRNRLVKTEQDATGLDVFTEYAYDALDRLVDVEDPQGLHTHYTFDGLGNQKQLTSPDTGIATYSYDAAGNRTGQADARNVASSFTYDALNRLTATSYPATPALNAIYAWDTRASGCPASNHYTVGRMGQVTDSSGSTRFCFDRYGETVQKIATIASGTLAVTYSWNKDGRLSQLTAPKGTQISYTRDNAQRIKTVGYQLEGQSAPTTLVSAVSYLPFGPASNIAYGNGRSLARNYDLDYVARGVVDGSVVGDGLNLTFGRDAVGNLNSVRTSATVGNKLVYDGLNRLTRVNDLNDNPHWHYSYDDTGNRLAEQQGALASVPYTYDPASHHLLAVGAATRQYDASGNTQQIGTDASRVNFVYDDSGRMNQVKVGGTQAKLYLTNALGQRVRKSKSGDSSQTVKTVYDEAGHILGDFDVGNAIVDEYMWMDDLPVGVLDGATNTVKYIEPDHLGSPRVMIDPVANHAIWSWPILDDPFGKGQPVNLNGSTFALNLRFPGQKYDAESGMNYSYLRDYDAARGRYLESDPAGLKDGLATYGHASSNPLAFRPWR